MKLDSCYQIVQKKYNDSIYELLKYHYPISSRSYVSQCYFPLGVKRGGEGFLFYLSKPSKEQNKDLVTLIIIKLP